VPVLLITVSMFGLGLGCGESGGTTGSGGTAGAGGAGGEGGSAAPVITKVQWDWADPCEPTTGALTVTDLQDNSETVNLGFFHCESDEVCEGGDPCE
jgi:hypothetical protein